MAETVLLIDGVPINGPESPRVTLELAAHTTVSVVGEENTGVGNLGRVALGLIPPGDGRVTVMGTELATLSRTELLAYRRLVGYLPAGDGLLHNLTLHQNVALPLQFGSNFSESEITSRLNIMLAAARLTGAEQIRPAQANDEQRRRAALARALAFDPDLVVLEEVFVGLTAKAARDVLETARGGDLPQGSRRTVLTIGPVLPSNVIKRFDVQYRMTRQGLQRED
jgi:ABC-type transporter Mla maintaining outer membrane lipid asymmetry ATPase subunit MlaF